jgi:hypothetical protein
MGSKKQPPPEPSPDERARARARKRRIYRALRWSLLVLGCGLLTKCGATGCLPGYSEGERAGLVTKLSRKGMIWKTWEGELTMGGIARDVEGSSIANVWAFTVRDEAVAKALGAALESGAQVSVQYRQYLLRPITQNTGYDVLSVRRR